MFYKKCLQLLNFHQFSFNSSLDDLEHWKKRKFFLKLKSKLWLYVFVVTAPRSSPKTLTLTADEGQKLPDRGKAAQKAVSCLKLTWEKSRGKVFVNFRTDTDKLNVVVYHNLNLLYPKDSRIYLKITENGKLWIERVYLLSSIYIISERAIVLDEKVVEIWNSFHQEWLYSFYWVLSDFYSRAKNSFEHNTVRKNLSIGACCCWDDKLPLR